MQHGNIRARCRFAVGLGCVETVVKIGTIANVLGEKPQLAGGAATLAVQTGVWQAGFLGANLGNRLRPGLDFVGDCLQKISARGTDGVAERPKRIFGGQTSAVDQMNAANRKLMRRTMRRAGSKGPSLTQPFACDQMLAVRSEGYAWFLVA